MANIVMLVPQGVATWRHRRNAEHLLGMSWMTYAMISFQAFIWMMYSFVAHDVWVGLPTFVNLPIALFTTIIVYRAHRQVG